jgi:ribosomal protein S16
MHPIIRLQNHGCRNHPYWWLVVAPKNSNIKGIFIEHIGLFILL